MISIAGITMPESSIWQNEMEYGSPISDTETCTEGSRLIYTSGYSKEVDIYIPKTAGELTRQTVISLKALSDGGGQIYINIRGQEMQAVFRHADNALDLKPIRAKQQQEDTDSYYGTIRLLEV